MAHRYITSACSALVALTLSIVAAPPGSAAEGDEVVVSPAVRVAGSGDFTLDVSGTLQPCAGREVFFTASDFEGAGDLSEFDDRVLADDSGALSGTVRVNGEFYDHPGVLTLDPGCEQDAPSGPVGGSPDLAEGKLLLIPATVPSEALALEVSSTSVAPGQSITLRASGFNTLFDFGAALQSTGALLALGPVAEDGSVSVTVTIPSSTPLGRQTIVLLGNSDEGLRAYAADIEVREATPDPEVAPAPERAAGVTRLAGSDRFSTAAATSRGSFPGTVNDVFIVTGLNWPDALSAGPAAAEVDAPVLPVQTTAVPTAISEEIDRLQPRRAWVVGGPSVVSDSVLDDLRSRGIEAVRISGSGRYETAAAVAARFFPDASGAYYASGAGYADALGGGAAAAQRGWPLLLTEKETVPAATPVLGSDRIVLGGPAAISEQVRTQLDARRVAGGDRYSTAAAIARDAFDATSVGYLATGLNFPDALAGAPAAARDGAPLLLAADGCVTAATRDAFDELGVASRVVLGGPAVVSDQAADLTVCRTNALAAAQVSAGDGHTCAVTAAGAAKCWGWNDRGQLGNGGRDDSGSPVDVQGLSSGVSAVSAGANFTCALTTAGAVSCWGQGIYGQLGNGSSADSSLPVPVTGLASGVVAIDVGYVHACALTDRGAVQCWGFNASGELGDGTSSNRAQPVTVTGLRSGVAEVSAGAALTCAVLTTGAARCWGDNVHGQLGDGSRNASSIPVDVAGLSTGVSTVSAAMGSACAVQDGAAQCWGDDSYGQLGDGSENSTGRTVRVSGLDSGTTAVAGGFRRANCALVPGGEVRCWGANDYGQLGNGTRQEGAEGTASPTGVVDLASVHGLSVGGAHACVVTQSGGIRCWGHNSRGQLGAPTAEDSSVVPVAVVGFG